MVPASFLPVGTGVFSPSKTPPAVISTPIASASKLPKNVLLPVVFDEQDHALSCEVAGLKMLLKYKGIDVDESELIEKIGFDSPRHADGVWGNPWKAFVGNIDGRMMSTGYGVYWRPVARVANEYRESQGFDFGKISDIVYALDHNNPVMIWGYLGSGKQTSWKTPEGDGIKAVYYEHIFVVVGYNGSPENPDGFHVIDTLYGPQYWSRDTFLARWNALDRSGVVVY